MCGGEGPVSREEETAGRQTERQVNGREEIGGKAETD